MDISSSDRIASQPASPAQWALTALSLDTGDRAALATLAGSDVLVPVPDDADDVAASDPTTVALPVLEQPGGGEAVPVFTSEPAMAALLPFVSRYRLVPLGALASQWPDDDLSLTIDAGSPHGLTLAAHDVAPLLGRYGI
ncbi:SseB family protein [Streptomyces ipomoeae]|uniref:SseB family protein n=1 Tax=Streptomyces ipomoeae TaxID=103232 RepID=UPI001146714B|nr:SseB family protein [Streptomyces ipomoeae]MDX2937312.1 SseB family protein [Streptomyces ipomoeae]TQE27236.1 SseB family protein [Streptomyces ipomoeae]